MHYILRKNIIFIGFFGFFLGKYLCDGLLLLSERNLLMEVYRRRGESLFNQLYGLLMLPVYLRLRRHHGGRAKEESVWFRRWRGLYLSYGLYGTHYLFRAVLHNYAPGAPSTIAFHVELTFSFFVPASDRLS